MRKKGRKEGRNEAKRRWRRRKIRLRNGKTGNNEILMEEGNKEERKKEGRALR